MSFAQEMQQVAKDLLGPSFADERKGDARLAILKQGETTWDPVEAEDVIGPDVKYFLQGVQQVTNAGAVNGTTIEQGDQFITCSTHIVDESGAVVDYVPEIKDKMLIDGETWSIVDAPHVKYTGEQTYITFKMQVRK